MDDEEGLSAFFEYGSKVKQFLTSEQGTGFLLEQQHAALLFISDWFEDEQVKKRVCTIVLPTGCGKSGIAVLAPYYLSSTRCLVIAPGTKVYQQLLFDFVGYDPNKPNDEEAKTRGKSFFIGQKILKSAADRRFPTVHAVVAGKTLNSVALRHHLTVVNAQKFSKAPKKMERTAAQQQKAESEHWLKALPMKDFDLVIVDEAHHFPASFWEIAVSKAQESSCKILFLTATPFRTDKNLVIKELDQQIPNGPFATKYPGKYFFHIRLREAQEKGYIRKFKLAPCTQTIVPLDHPDGLQSSDKDKKRFGSFQIILQMVAQALQFNDANFALPNGQQHCAMILAGSVADAQTIYKLSQGMVDLRSFNLLPYYGNLKNKQSNLNNFDENHHKVPVRDRCRMLVVVDTLREGYNYPSVSVVAICTNVTAAVKYYQFIGRGVRRIKGEINGTACHVIYHPEMFPNLPNLHQVILEESLIPPTYEEQLTANQGEASGDTSDVIDDGDTDDDDMDTD